MRFHKSNNLYGDGFFNTIFEDVSGVGANDEPAIDNQLFKIGGTGKSIIPNGIDRKEVVDVTDDKSVQYHGKCFARSVLRGIPKRGHSDGNRTAFTFLNDDLKSLYVILVNSGFDETELEWGVELNTAPQYVVVICTNGIIHERKDTEGMITLECGHTIAGINVFE